MNRHYPSAEAALNIDVAMLEAMQVSAKGDLASKKPKPCNQTTASDKHSLDRRHHHVKQHQP